MIIDNKEFDTKNHTYIMGILNVTPDSFSDGGNWNEISRALAHAEKMIQEGASVIDVGGESTRPGYTKISDSEEIDRVAPVIEKIRSELGVPVSIDTYKSRVADAALNAGAGLVNDIWGFKYDPEMARTVKKYDASCCLMHNKKDAVYGNPVKDICDELRESIAIAKRENIADHRILLDPGIGFGKDYHMNLLVMKNLSRFHELGYPMLLGASRKSMIGQALGLPKEQREEGTLATTVMAVMSGYAFVRVHDVEKNFRAVKMTEAIRNAE